MKYEPSDSFIEPDKSPWIDSSCASRSPVGPFGSCCEPSWCYSGSVGPTGPTDASGMRRPTGATSREAYGATNICTPNETLTDQGFLTNNTYKTS